MERRRVARVTAGGRPGELHRDGRLDEAVPRQRPTRGEEETQRKCAALVRAPQPLRPVAHGEAQQGVPGRPRDRVAACREARPRRLVVGRERLLELAPQRVRDVDGPGGESAVRNDGRQHQRLAHERVPAGDVRSEPVEQPPVGGEALGDGDAVRLETCPRVLDPQQKFPIKPAGVHQPTERPQAVLLTGDPHEAVNEHAAAEIAGHPHGVEVVVGGPREVPAARALAPVEKEQKGDRPRREQRREGRGRPPARQLGHAAAAARGLPKRRQVLAAGREEAVRLGWEGIEGSGLDPRRERAGLRVRAHRGRERAIARPGVLVDRIASQDGPLVGRAPRVLRSPLGHAARVVRAERRAAPRLGPEPRDDRGHEERGRGRAQARMTPAEARDEPGENEGGQRRGTGENGRRHDVTLPRRGHDGAGAGREDGRRPRRGERVPRERVADRQPAAEGAAQEDVGPGGGEDHGHREGPRADEDGLEAPEEAKRRGGLLAQGPLALQAEPLLRRRGDEAERQEDASHEDQGEDAGHDRSVDGDRSNARRRLTPRRHRSAHRHLRVRVKAPPRCLADGGGSRGTCGSASMTWAEYRTPTASGRRRAGAARRQACVAFFIPAGTCSSCRCSSSSITGRSSLNEK
ncbi:MAG: hypothetical protein U0599_12095 [Vicinamibacteria bacterium]